MPPADFPELSLGHGVGKAVHRAQIRAAFQPDGETATPLLQGPRVEGEAVRTPGDGGGRVVAGGAQAPA